MFRRVLRSRVSILSAGIVTGLAVTSLTAFSVLHWTGFFKALDERWLETQLHAAAAQSGETMAVATGAIDEGVEGIFVLDFISGNLTCGVLNPRTGQLGGFFRRNIANDLGAVQGKQPKYLMVTGVYASPPRGSNLRPAQSLLYVADANTGRYAAYSLPWNPQLLNTNQPQVRDMTLIGGGTARNVALE